MSSSANEDEETSFVLRSSHMSASRFHHFARAGALGIGFSHRLLSSDLRNVATAVSSSSSSPALSLHTGFLRSVMTACVRAPYSFLITPLLVETISSQAHTGLLSRGDQGAFTSGLQLYADQASRWLGAPEKTNQPANPVPAFQRLKSHLAHFVGAASGSAPSPLLGGGGLTVETAAYWKAGLDGLEETSELLVGQQAPAHCGQRLLALNGSHGERSLSAEVDSCVARSYSEGLAFASSSLDRAVALWQSDACAKAGEANARKNFATSMAMLGGPSPVPPPPPPSAPPAAISAGGKAAASSKLAFAPMKSAKASASTAAQGADKGTVTIQHPPLLRGVFSLLQARWFPVAISSSSTTSASTQAAEFASFTLPTPWDHSFEAKVDALFLSLQGQHGHEQPKGEKELSRALKEWSERSVSWLTGLLSMASASSPLSSSLFPSAVSPLLDGSSLLPPGVKLAAPAAPATAAEKELEDAARQLNMGPNSVRRALSSLIRRRDQVLEVDMLALMALKAQSQSQSMSSVAVEVASVAIAERCAFVLRRILAAITGVSADGDQLKLDQSARWLEHLSSAIYSGALSSLSSSSVAANKRVEEALAPLRASLMAGLTADLGRYLREAAEALSLAGVAGPLTSSSSSSSALSPNKGSSPSKKTSFAPSLSHSYKNSGGSTASSSLSPSELAAKRRGKAVRSALLSARLPALIAVTDAAETGKSRKSESAFIDVADAAAALLASLGNGPFARSFAALVSRALLAEMKGAAAADDAISGVEPDADLERSLRLVTAYVAAVETTSEALRPYLFVLPASPADASKRGPIQQRSAIDGSLLFSRLSLPSSASSTSSLVPSDVLLSLKLSGFKLGVEALLVPLVYGASSTNIGSPALLQGTRDLLLGSLASLRRHLSSSSAAATGTALSSHLAPFSCLLPSSSAAFKNGGYFPALPQYASPFFTRPADTTLTDGGLLPSSGGGALSFFEDAISARPPPQSSGLFAPSLPLLAMHGNSGGSIAVGSMSAFEWDWPRLLDGLENDLLSLSISISTTSGEQAASSCAIARNAVVGWYGSVAIDIIRACLDACNAAVAEHLEAAIETVATKVTSGLPAAPAGAFAPTVAPPSAASASASASGSATAGHASRNARAALFALAESVVVTGRAEQSLSPQQAALIAEYAATEALAPLAGGDVLASAFDDLCAYHATRPKPAAASNTAHGVATDGIDGGAGKSALELLASGTVPLNGYAPPSEHSHLELLSVSSPSLPVVQALAEEAAVNGYFSSALSQGSQSQHQAAVCPFPPHFSSAGCSPFLLPPSSCFPLIPPPLPEGPELGLLVATEAAASATSGAGKQLASPYLDEQSCRYALTVLGGSTDLTPTNAPAEEVLPSTLMDRTAASSETLLSSGEAASSAAGDSAPGKAPSKGAAGGAASASADTSEGGALKPPQAAHHERAGKHSTPPPRPNYFLSFRLVDTIPDLRIWSHLERTQEDMISKYPHLKPMRVPIEHSHFTIDVLVLDQKDDKPFSEGGKGVKAASDVLGSPEMAEAVRSAIDACSSSSPAVASALASSGGTLPVAIKGLGTFGNRVLFACPMQGPSVEVMLAVAGAIRKVYHTHGLTLKAASTVAAGQQLPSSEQGLDKYARDLTLHSTLFKVSKAGGGGRGGRGGWRGKGRGGRGHPPQAASQAAPAHADGDASSETGDESLHGVAPPSSRADSTAIPKGIELPFKDTAFGSESAAAEATTMAVWEVQLNAMMGQKPEDTLFYQKVASLPLAPLLVPSSSSSTVVDTASNFEAAELAAVARWKRAREEREKAKEQVELSAAVAEEAGREAVLASAAAAAAATTPSAAADATDLDESPAPAPSLRDTFAASVSATLAQKRTAGGSSGGSAKKRK